MAFSAIVIGAGPAGLAAAACLRAKGADVTIFERNADVASSWRNHYDSLRLHTSRGRSGLPGLAMPARVGRYPDRKAVIAYLEDYARHHKLAPVFDCPVTRVARAEKGWQVIHAKGVAQADVVVVACGLNAQPVMPEWPGNFAGQMIHSSAYRNTTPFKGKRVLVVGFGNSGGDIARDLAQDGIAVDMAVRSPVNLLPKELFGIPITSFGLLGKILPYKVADALTAPILRMKHGQPSDYGLRSANKGPMTQVIEDGRVPLIDVGTLADIKAGKIGVRPDVVTLAGHTVTFADSTSADYDVIIAATGYSHDLRPILGNLPSVLDADGAPRVSGGPTGARGLYFCSYRVSPNGQLHLTASEARAIAKHAAQSALATA